MMKLDKFDRCILSSLQDDAKLTISELSEKCGLSRTPVHERLKKLEETGAIRAYQTKLDPAIVGFDIHAFCNVSLKEHAQKYLENFEQEITACYEVIACHHIAGMFDYLLEIRVADMKAYQYFISKKLASIENIGNVQSSFVMKEILPQRGIEIIKQTAL
ncbi:MAG: Lrp/AsnC family transcriptional regulator [Flavobacteriales bacterium]|nr:Lrp/AsnC family transcriptional regulator [Flavobacteriales bacterium]